MSTYEGTFAELYDLFHEDKPYAAEAQFVDHAVRTVITGPATSLLDVACGTGRHAVHLARLGWTVLGVDRSEDMLRRAAAVRDREGVTVRFERQDMTRIDLGSRSFDAATCLFDSIGYGITNEAIGATLEGMRRHIRTGGVLVMEFWHAPAMVRGYEPVRVREWERDGERVLRISRTSLDIVAQTARVDYSVYRFRRDGRVDIWNESHRNRFFQLQEISLFLERAGFEPVRWFAGFREDAPIEAQTWHVVVIARAEAADS